MQIFTKNGRVVMYKGRIAISPSCCSCTVDTDYGSGTGGGGPCDSSMVGCCCFGTGSLPDVDQCSCETMQGTWRANCSGCATTDGGNTGPTDGAPPAGECNICRDLVVSFVTGTEYFSGCELYSGPNCLPGAFFPCEDAIFNCSSVGGISTAGGVLVCGFADCATNWSGYSSSTFGCSCSGTDCKPVGGCGSRNEADSYESFRISGSACGASGGNFEEITNTTTTTSPGYCDPDTLTEKTYIIRQLAGRLTLGFSTTKSYVEKYRGQVSGTCPTSTNGSNTGSTSLTCT